MLYLLFISLLVGALPQVARAQDPMLTEVMSFAPIPVGAQREQRLRIDNLPANGYYEVTRAPQAPFSITSDDKSLVIDRGSIELRVEFAPFSQGDFRDDIILQRVPVTGNTAVDQIRIRLFGTAFKIERSDEVSFDGVMTGDTSKQVVLYRTNRSDDFAFEYVGILEEPFHVLTSQGPVPRGFDTLAVVIAFSPNKAGDYTDSIGLVRKDRQGRRLDTAMIYVRGTGRIMPKSVDVDLRNLTAGDATSRTITVDVPEKIQSVNFSYSIEPRAAAPYTTASIKSPLGPSKSQQLTLTVTANPQNKVDERSTYMLLRRGVADRLLDSTELVLDVQASSRPVRFTVSSDTDTLTARIGDTVDVNIRARTNDPIDEPIELSSLQFDLSYNPTVFVPIRSSGQTLSVVNDQQILTTVIDAFAVPLAITTDGQIIGTVRGVVALGDADYSPLAISSVAFVRGQNQTDTMANGQAILRITNVWRYADGRTRLANPLQGTMMMDIDPNPVIDNSTLRLRNIPQGTGSLVVIDALGVLRQDLTTALKGGKRDFTVASSGSADIVLSPGTYYARCAIESVLGGTLNSIVRVFVVQ